MPTYCFVCTECEDKIPMDYKMKMEEWNVQEVECWVCGGVAKKVPARTSFELKGGGWFGSGYTKGD